MIARININIEGTTITHFDSISVVQPFDHHHRIDVRLSMEDVNELLGFDGTSSAATLGRLTQDWAGKKLTLRISQGETDLIGLLSPDLEQTFEGVIVKIEMQMQDQVNSVVRIRAMSPTFLLDQTENTYSFSDSPLSDIASMVLRGTHATNEVSPANNPTIPYTTCYRETPFNFLQRTARRFGEWFYYDGLKTHFGKPSGSSPAIELEYGSTIRDMSYEARLVHLNAQGVFYDYLPHGRYVYETTGTEVDAQNVSQQVRQASLYLMSSKPVDISYQNYPDQGALTEDVKRQLRAKSTQMVVLRGTCLRLGLAPGSSISVSDNVEINGITARNDLYGDFLVTQANHYVDANGEYQCTFEAIPGNPTFPPTTYPYVREPYAAPHVGVITSTADPDSLGRVQVKISWFNSSATSPWLRVSQPMAGNGRGAYFIPEVDELVFVDFEMGNPDMPFVRGTMHTNTNKPDGLFTSSNVIKGIITKGGNHVMIDDTGGKETISIFNNESKNEIILSLEGTPHINIKSDNKISMTAPTIEMDATNIIMKAKQVIEMTSDKDITAHAKSNWVAEADLLANLKSLFTKVEATATMQVTSKSVTTVSALGALGLSGLVGVKMGSPGKLEVTSPAIEIKAKKSISSSFFDWAKEAIGISVAAVPSLTMESEGSANVKADMSVEVDGMDVLIESKGVGKFKAGAMAEIKGGMVTIN